MKTIKKACKGTLYPKASSVSKKLKKGGSFDLNKDGKTTFKDVLIGRGVLPKTAKKGTKVKKAQTGTVQDLVNKAAAGKPAPEKRSIPRPAPMKKGGKMTKKCKYGCK